MTRPFTQRTLSELPPNAAGDAAFKVFCTPSLSDKRSSNHNQLVERARFHLRDAARMRMATSAGEVQCYVLDPVGAESAGTVLFVHGWSGEAAFMSVLAEPIRRAGFRVVLFDLPAHGLSGGRHTHLVDCAKATVEVACRVGPIEAVVAHSIGGMIALFAAEGRAPLPGALRTSAVVLIACPNALSDLTRDFCAGWAMTSAGRRAFERRLKRIGRRTVGETSTLELLRASGCRALVVHDRNDEDVPFSCAEEIAGGYPSAELAAFEGFGHRTILFAPPVLRMVARHLSKLQPRGDPIGRELKRGWTEHATADGAGASPGL